METGGNNHSRAALVVAHPSHELRVHGWLQRSRPYVFVLTDGSGRAAEPRLQSTTRVLTEVGAQRGSVYGRARDIDVYDALLKRNFPFFINIAEELAREFDRNQIEYMVGDSDEGCSPTHDACRLLTNAASGNSKEEGPKANCQLRFCRRGFVWMKKPFARKIAAARAYKSKLALDVEVRVAELSSQVAAALNAYPELEKKGHSSGEPIEIPFYELYGEKMVAAGHYQKTIRFTEHFQPLVKAFSRHVGR